MEQETLQKQEYTKAALSSVNESDEGKNQANDSAQNEPKINSTEKSTTQVGKINERADPPALGETKPEEAADNYE